MIEPETLVTSRPVYRVDEIDPLVAPFSPFLEECPSCFLIMSTWWSKQPHNQKTAMTMTDCVHKSSKSYSFVFTHLLMPIYAKAGIREPTSGSGNCECDQTNCPFLSYTHVNSLAYTQMPCHCQSAESYLGHAMGKVQVPDRGDACRWKAEILPRNLLTCPGNLIFLVICLVGFQE